MNFIWNIWGQNWVDFNILNINNFCFQLLNKISWNKLLVEFGLGPSPKLESI